MKQYFLGLLLMLFAVCGSVSPATASPLDTFDQDRLWVLLRVIEIDFSDHCSYYYRGEKGRPGGGYVLGDIKEVCAEFTDKLATYLAHNGVSGVKPVHLQTPAFWNSLLARDIAIEACRKQLGGTQLTPPAHERPRRPDSLDYDTYEELRAAEAEYFKQDNEQEKKHQRAWRGCDPYLRALDARDIAIEACREQLGGNASYPPADKIPPEPYRRDYATSQEYSAAFREYSEKSRKLGRDHLRAWRDCDPYAKTRLNRQEVVFDWLDIRLPAGLRETD